jgi:hypothetical protein
MFEKYANHICTFYTATYMYISAMDRVLYDAVYRRRTDNTMAKRKSTKGQTIYKTYI